MLQVRTDDAAQPTKAIVFAVQIEIRAEVGRNRYAIGACGANGRPTQRALGRNVD